MSTPATVNDTVTDLPATGERPGTTPKPARPPARTRPATTTAFTVAGAHGFITAINADDQAHRPTEIHLIMAKQGSTLRGMTEALSVAISIGLQHGAPLETYVEKFSSMRFEPAGLTDDTEIPTATSIIDYIARRLALDHLTTERNTDPS